MRGDWAFVFFHDESGKVIYSKIVGVPPDPTPRIGETVLVSSHGDGLLVTDIHIDYDERKIKVFCH